MKTEQGTMGTQLNQKASCRIDYLHFQVDCAVEMYS